MIDLEILKIIILGLPNWVGFVILSSIQYRFNQRVLQMLERCLEAQE
jgi:hypothetical protein